MSKICGKDCDKVLQKLEDANLTLSGEKSAFGQPEVLMVGHLCGAYGRKPSPTKWMLSKR